MPMILLVYKEAYFNTNERDPYISSVCVSLLRDYKDIFSEEIPSGLLPIRGIKHQINHIPRVAIPNQPAYKVISRRQMNFKGKCKS